MYVKLLLGSDLPPSIVAGPGLVFPHGARGVFINGDVHLGRHVVIQQQVTIGNRPSESRAATIGDNVTLGAKASIIGPVKIGAGAFVGAHALVTRDVPAGALVKAAAVEIVDAR